MKQWLLVIFVCFQSIVFSVALAWSPLAAFSTGAVNNVYCHSTIAASEQEQGDQNKQPEEEEEEEPDCD